MRCTYTQIGRILEVEPGHSILSMDLASDPRRPRTARQAGIMRRLFDVLGAEFGNEL